MDDAWRIHGGALAAAVHGPWSKGHVLRTTGEDGHKGKIIRFYCYQTQDHREHAAGDPLVASAKLSKNPDCGEEFLAGVPGALDAVAHCVAILEMVKAATPWLEAADFLATEVFALETLPPA